MIKLLIVFGLIALVMWATLLARKQARRTRNARREVLDRLRDNMEDDDKSGRDSEARIDRK